MKIVQMIQPCGLYPTNLQVLDLCSSSSNRSSSQ